MNRKELSQWRTVFVTGGAFLVQAAGFWWGSKNQSEMVQKMYGDLCWANVILVGLVAGKALGQHLGGAGGLKGLVGSLLGDRGSTPQVEPPRTP